MFGAMGRALFQLFKSENRVAFSWVDRRLIFGSRILNDLISSDFSQFLPEWSVNNNSSVLASVAMTEMLTR